MLKRITLLLTVVCSLAFTTMLAFADLPLGNDSVLQLEQNDVVEVDALRANDLIYDTESVSYAEIRRNSNLDLSHLLNQTESEAAFEVGWQYSF